MHISHGDTVRLRKKKMPTYTLKDTTTNKQWDVICSYKDLQTTLDEMPELVHILGMPKVIHERGTNIKVDDGFREVMSRVKDSAGVKHMSHTIKDY